MDNSLLVIGGMGEQAGISFHKSLVALDVNVVARTDNAHPCRVAALASGGESPAQSIARTIEMASQYIKFNRWIVACNTAHAFLEEVKAMLPAYLAGMAIDLVDSAVRIASTEGFLWLGTTALAHMTNLIRRGRTMLPSDKDQEIVQQAIWDAKRGVFTHSSEIRRIVDGRTIIAGCTEMPSILRAAEISRFADPVDFIRV